MLVQLESGDSHGSVRDVDIADLDRDGCITIGFEKYLVTNQVLDLPDGRVVRRARLVFD